MKLIGNRIILREIKKEVKKGAIILATDGKGNAIVPEGPFIRGKIIAVGDGVKESKYGSVVLVNRQMAGFIEWNNEMLHMVAEEDIIAHE